MVAARISKLLLQTKFWTLISPSPGYLPEGHCLNLPSLLYYYLIWRATFQKRKICKTKKDALTLQGPQCFIWIQCGWKPVQKNTKYTSRHKSFWEMITICGKFEHSSKMWITVWCIYRQSQPNLGRNWWRSGRFSFLDTATLGGTSIYASHSLLSSIHSGTLLHMAVIFMLLHHISPSSVLGDPLRLWPIGRKVTYLILACRKPIR